MIESSEVAICHTFHSPGNQLLFGCRMFGKPALTEQLVSSLHLLAPNDPMPLRPTSIDQFSSISLFDLHGTREKYRFLITNLKSMVTLESRDLKRPKLDPHVQIFDFA
jgi:hypothetical protein